MIIDDLVILGRACPELLSDGRITVCTAGYSGNLGFVRIYPTRTNMRWKRWDVVRVEVEDDSRDTRDESWKIAGSKSEWDNLATKVEIVGRLPRDQWLNLVAELEDGCVQDINSERRSLGIVKPEVLRAYFQENPRYGELFQLTLPGMGESTIVKRDFPLEPRVTYRCRNCRTTRPHDQQILEWGFYEWMRKNPDNPDQVWENAKYGSPNHQWYFFVGNQLKYRSSFMVISVLRLQSGTPAPRFFPLRKWTKKATSGDSGTSIDSGEDTPWASLFEV